VTLATETAGGLVSMPDLATPSPFPRSSTPSIAFGRRRSSISSGCGKRWNSTTAATPESPSRRDASGMAVTRRTPRIARARLVGPRVQQLSLGGEAVLRLGLAALEFNGVGGLVRFDDDLRRVTENAAAVLRELFSSARTPPAEYERRKCSVCSLLELCRPQSFGRAAKAWREPQVRDALGNPSAPASP
jgi:hypothetical protein